MAVSDQQPLTEPPADARLRAAWEAIRRPDVKVVSTDVFDTLLWRQVAEPVDAFLLVGERLARRRRIVPNLSPGAFRNLRRHAEHQARVARAHAFNDLEVTLEEIWARLADRMFGTPALDRCVGVDTELAVERQLLLPDLDVASLLAQARAAGKAVVAVSDTYFSEAQLRELLDQPGLGDLQLDRIFSSSEHRRSKVDGLLGTMLEEMDVGPAAVVHLGDDDRADYAPAQALGIAPLRFERHLTDLAALLTQEQRFAEPLPPSEGKLLPELTSLRGKVAARAEGVALPPALQPYWKTGALVLGPVLTGFAEWVQERAAEHRLQRVFCFMREGELLSALINRAGVARGLPARAERLWLNRETLAAAAIGMGRREELEPLLVRRRTPTVAELLRAVGLTVVDVPGFVTHADTRLDDLVVRENLFDALTGDTALTARIVEHARVQRERVVAYVEGLLGGDELIGVVDLGWGATAQRMLEITMLSAGRKAGVVGFYLLTHEGPAAAGTNARGYLGEFGDPENAAKTVTRTPEILEQVCMPDHGPQIGLDERLQPVLRSAAHDRLQMAEAGALRAGAESFQREWARYVVAAPGKLPSLGQGAHVLRPLLLRQILAPTELEAATLGAWAHDENQGSERAEAIADLRHAGRLRHLSPDQLRRVRMEELYWPAGLAVRADPGAAELYAAAAAGEIPWASLSTAVEAGEFSITAIGTDVDPDSAIRAVPRRNRHGLSEVFGSITAPAITGLVIVPATKPAVVRLDYLVVTASAQGDAEPVVLELQEPQDFARLERANLFVVNPNVFVAHSHSPQLRVDLRSLTPRTIHKVDVRCGFAILPISELLPTPGRLRTVEDAGVQLEALEQHSAALRRELDGLYGSLSWRITRPLRLLKRFR